MFEYPTPVIEYLILTATWIAKTLFVHPKYVGNDQCVLMLYGDAGAGKGTI